MLFRLGSRVKILDKENNQRFNYGKVIGVDLRSDNSYFDQTTEKNFIKRFNLPFYKVAYVDCISAQVCCEWFAEKDLEKAKN